MARRPIARAKPRTAITSLVTASAAYVIAVTGFVPASGALVTAQSLLVRVVEDEKRSARLAGSSVSGEPPG
jgi:hypothetical protein